MDSSFFANTAFVILLLFFAVYSMLDGFALGIGCMIPFVRNRSEADGIVSYIAPFWEVNEVWLIMGVGFLFGAFPATFSILLPVFYLPFMATIAAFVLRAAALEFSYHDPAHLATWRILLGLGSFMAAITAMVALGFMIQGLPFTGPGVVSGSVTGAASVFPALFGITGVSLLAWHGVVFSVGKGSSGILPGWSWIIWGVTFVLSVATSCLWIVQAPELLTRPIALAGGVIYFTGLGVSRLFLSKGPWAFRASASGIMGFWITVGASLFPLLLRASNNTSWSISIQHASAPISSLRILVMAIPVLILLIIGYNCVIHRVIRRSDRAGRGEGGKLDG